MFYLLKTIVKLSQTYTAQQKTGLKFYLLYCELFFIFVHCLHFRWLYCLWIWILDTVIFIILSIFQACNLSSGSWKLTKRGGITSCWLILCWEVDQQRSTDLRALIQRWDWRGSSSSWEGGGELFKKCNPSFVLVMAAYPLTIWKCMICMLKVDGEEVLKE